MHVTNMFVSSFFRTCVFFIPLALIIFTSYAQTTIVGWNFEDGNNIADVGTAANSAKTIYTEARNISGASYLNVGTGANGLAIQLDGWDQGNGIKYWVVEFNAAGFENLIFSSRQCSDKNGPEFFGAEYSTDGSVWTAISGGPVQIASSNDWSTGILSNISLPAVLDNQPSIFIRWIMTSNERVNGGGNVTQKGRSRIDDILVQGDLIPPSEININTTSTPVTSNILSDSDQNELYGVSLAVSSRDAILTDLRLTTDGSYTTSDLKPNGFKLWYSSDAIFDGDSDTQLQEIDVVASGVDLIFSGLSQNIAAGTTGYIFLTVDIGIPNSNNQTISIGTPLLSNFSFSPPVTISGSVSSGNVQTIKLALSVYSFTGASGNEPSFASDIQPTNAIVSNISRGTGIIESSLANAFSSSNWPLSGIGNNSYYEITITAENGHSIDIHGIQLDHRSTVEGPTNWEIRSSLDGYSNNLGGTFTSTADGNWNRDAVADFGTSLFGQSSVTLRIYAYNRTSESGIWAVDNIYILGKSNDIQVPSFVAGYPKADSSRNDGFHLQVNADEPVTAFYQILTYPSVPPTAIDVRSNPNGSIVATSANAVYSNIITGLSPETGYDVYFVLDDGTNQSGLDQSLKNIRTSDEDATITEPSAQIPGASISSIADSPEAAIDVFSFTINDGGGADNSPTIVTGIQIAQVGVPDLRNVVAGVTLNKGSGTQMQIADQTINANNIEITLDPDQLIIQDGNSEEVTIGIYLQPSGLVDNQSMAFAIDVNQQFTTSDYYTQFAMPSTPNIILGEVHTIDVTATKLTVNSHSSQAGRNKDIDLEIYATDANGNLDTDESSNVTVALGYNTQGGSLSVKNPPPNFTESLINGIFLWDNLRYDEDDIIALIVTSSILTADTTGTILIGDLKDLIVNSDLTLSSELTGLRDVIINDGATLTLARGVILGLERNFIFNGTGALNDLGATTLFNSGKNKTQTISKSTSTTSEQFYNIEIDVGNNSIVNNEISMELLNTLKMVDGTIDVDGTANDKNFTLISTPSNTARISAMENSTEIRGDIIWQRSLRVGPAGWRYIGTPVKGQTLGSISDDVWIQGITERYPNSWTNIATYSEPFGSDSESGRDGWIDFTSNTNGISTGTGMKLWLWDIDYITEQKIVMKGPPIVGDGLDGIADDGEIYVFPTPSYTPSSFGGGGWNFYANPYPSEIDWKLVTTINLSGSSVYIWNPNAQAYGSYNPFTNQGTNGVTQFIGSGQGFFIKANGPVSSLQMTEASKSDQNGNSFLRTAEEIMPKLSVKATSEYGRTDETAIVFTDFATNDYDPDYDTEKLVGGWINLASVLENGKKIDINAMGKKGGAQIVKLSIQPYQFGKFTMTFPILESFTESDIILLQDNYLSKSMVITATSSYSFTMEKDIESSYGNGRFEILFIEPVKFHSNDIEAKSGIEFMVPVYADHLKNVKNIQLALVWDNETLSFVEVEKTNYSRSFDFDLKQINEGRLMVRDVYEDPINVPEGTRLFSMKFEALNGESKTQLKFEELQTTILGQNNIQIPFEVKDADITIIQNRTIQGMVSTYTGIGVDGAHVFAVGEQLIVDKTKNGGHYVLDAFENDNYFLSVEQPVDNKLNAGITTIDIIKARRHLLNIDKLESPYQIIAADINMSKSVSALDLHLMKLAVLGDDSGFKNGINWLLIPDKFDLDHDAFMFETGYEMSTQDDNTKLDFIAVKIGDVNNSWKAPTSGRRSDRNIALNLNNAKLENSIIDIPVIVNGFDNISGYQFSLTWEPAKLEFHGIENEALEALYNKHFVNEGILTTAWDEINGESVELENGSILFTLRLKVKGAMRGGIVEINSSLTEAIAYDSELNALGIKSSALYLNLDELGNEKLELGQNVPNPFNFGTRIEFKIAKGGRAKFTILNMLGGTIYVHEQAYSPGYYQMDWNKNQCLKPIPRGVYIYKLESNGEEVVKKMLIE